MHYKACAEWGGGADPSEDRKQKRHKERKTTFSLMGSIPFPSHSFTVAEVRLGPRSVVAGLLPIPLQACTETP